MTHWPPISMPTKEDMQQFAVLSIGGLVGIWTGFHPVMQTLLVFMVLDVATGILAAFVSQTLSSSVSFKGIAKKAMELLIVVASVWAGRAAGLNVPTGEVVAGFYATHELLSIVENAARAGLPIPDALRVALAKLGHPAQSDPSLEPRG